MWEYKIYKTNLGYWIYRKKYVGRILMIQFLHADNLWGVHKSTAKTFYTKEAALSALVIMKARWDKPIEEPKKEEEKKEIKSWSEL
jgi:hypothetical protein